ncbi:GNAT family N-acetyltransferase [Rubrobacter calidifluminis]|uniref:GNAT family N-acetyltransferase n=1 Tax=Rubrobacter calidifluminis TaxID=1392640 RepID=UPI002361570F|nr:GNAT family N-acetyltransferase [Rubrobacter calidifluminis]
MSPVEVREMLSDEEVAATFGVMRQLRPHLGSAEDYLRRVRRMRKEGYRLAAVLEDGEVRSVAGFRVQESLISGRHLYVDDLVTADDARSRGYGRMLFLWLAEEARREGCRELHLDSGVQRGRAHRFYFREGMEIRHYHFAMEL